MDLAGARIMVPESRELDLFCRMLEAEGAVTLRCPLVAILDLEDPAPVAEWLDRLIQSRFDDLILLTGEGLRRLLTVARTLGRDAAAITALGRVRPIARGPKPVRALREIGLTPGLSASVPTTEGIIALLEPMDLRGRGVGVQLYPDNPNTLLLDFLGAKGATPDPVTPYRYASGAEDAAVEAAIGDLVAGRVDLIAFTSSPQVRRFEAVAEAAGLTDELRRGLARTRIAAVGPVVSEALTRIGATVAITPIDSFHLKPMIGAIRDSLLTPFG
jgi:uroporphyrinogen-III synthase